MKIFLWSFYFLKLCSQWCVVPDIFTGLAEVSEGKVNGHEIHLLSNSVARMSFGADPQVLKVQIENSKLSRYQSPGIVLAILQIFRRTKELYNLELLHILFFLLITHKTTLLIEKKQDCKTHITHENWDCKIPEIQQTFCETHGFLMTIGHPSEWFCSPYNTKEHYRLLTLLA